MSSGAGVYVARITRCGRWSYLVEIMTVRPQGWDDEYQHLNVIGCDRAARKARRIMARRDLRDEWRRDSRVIR